MPQVIPAIRFLTSGADFIKNLLNPPTPATHPNPRTYLYNQLVQIQFPPNVKILPDKQLERRKRDELNAIKSRQAKMEQQKKEEELIQTIHKKRYEQLVVQAKRRRKEKKRIKQQEKALLDEQSRKEENYSQFYGRPR